MTRARPYAERTVVPVQQSKNEIERLLQMNGAGAIAMFTDDGRAVAAVAFTMAERSYRFVMPMPRMCAKGSREEKIRMQLARQRWRALLLVLKAKIESARSGVTTLETELLPYAVLPNGRTVADEVQPRLAANYKGQDVPLLPGV